jgi:hypothetical protein
MRRFRTLFVVSLFMACMHPGFLAYAEEPPRLTFAQLVDSIKAELELTQKIKSYSGKEVEIQGFIIPAGPPDLSFFLLRGAGRAGRNGLRVYGERGANSLRSFAGLQGARRV